MIKDRGLPCRGNGILYGFVIVVSLCAVNVLQQDLEHVVSARVHTADLREAHQTCRCKRSAHGVFVIVAQRSVVLRQNADHLLQGRLERRPERSLALRGDGRKDHIPVVITQRTVGILGNHVGQVFQVEQAQKAGDGDRGF